MSHRRRQRAEWPLPKRSKGALIWDLDNNRHVDFRLGSGPIILGHGDERVDRAARRGTSALATGLEASVAELMIEMVPSVETVRFANSGSEAVATALRAARGYSGRDGFAMVEGAAPEMAPIGKGIPEVQRNLVGLAPLNDADALEDLFRREKDRIGAFLMEPILGSCCSIASRQRYLEDVRRLCDRYDIVLIFDEATTGFRVGRGGAQELYGVLPDLSTFGKAMANGYPIAALGGRAEVMKVISDGDSVQHGGTLAVRPISLSAAEETLRILRDTDALLTIEKWGRALQAELGAVFRETELPHVFTGHPSMFGIMFQDRLPEGHRDWATSNHDLYDEMVRALPGYGLLPEPDSRAPWFVCEAHAELDPASIAYTVEEVIATLRR